MSEPLTIGFLGAGKMASALASGFLKANLVQPGQLMASDVYEGARTAFQSSVGCRTSASNAEVLKFANVIVLAVKPDQVREVIDEIRPFFTERHLLISICAGVTLAKLEDGLFESARVIRVMPNTPALVGASASAFALGESATAADAELAKKLFSSVGVAYQL